MRQGAEHTAPTSFSCTITCMIMLIIVNRIQFLYYSSYLYDLKFVRSQTETLAVNGTVLPVHLQFG